MAADIPVKEAARRLGVSERWLRTLADRGDLRARRAGWAYLVDAEDVERLKRHQRPPGRPLSAHNAWALLAMLTGEEPRWITPSARSRLRKALAYGAHPAALLRHSQPRSQIFRWRVLPSDLAKIATTHPFVRSGLSATPPDLDVVASRDLATLDAYVTQPTPEALRARLKPETASRRPNLLLRVPVEPWVLTSPSEAPAAVVAADLLEHDDSRVVRAGERLLERLAHDRDS
ncbi:MAG: helix-turn-helix domain-containing protein [Actinomycetota bacterium]|nr:helix-turn-helix domain-containing protein [Actinomycetota bacterium]